MSMMLPNRMRPVSNNRPEAHRQRGLSMRYLSTILVVSCLVSCTSGPPPADLVLSNGAIYTMEADGSRLMKLTADQGNNEDPCWSPDGRYIAFSSSREGQYHLYIMNANGQNQQRITYGKGDQTSPSWSTY